MHFALPITSVNMLQEFVNSRIHDVDKLATKVLQECARSEQFSCSTLLLALLLCLNETAS